MTPRKKTERTREDIWREHDTGRTGADRIAYRLGDRHGDRLRFVPGQGWHVRQHGTFLPDTTGSARLLVLDTLTAAFDEAETLPEPEGADLRLAVLRCSTAAGIGRVLRVASTLPPFLSGPGPRSPSTDDETR
ncbi:hypothetical protein ACFVSK_02380 [Cellulosimicrobium cellulans]|uniref:hypothetical protein n=1 Tax=Cellulosimicrobium cellulans TaxID=1710 RepID=UPI0036EAC563